MSLSVSKLLRLKFKPYLSNNFYLEDYHRWPYKKRVPFDYIKLSQDPSWISHLQSSSYLASNLTRIGNDTNMKIENLQNHINLYLNK